MIPVTVLTGFLGSGKTTLLNRLLQHDGFSDTAVIINEFGEIGIDHLLVTQVEENLRVLANGCLCCTVRGDLVDTLQDLSRRRATGSARFSRLIIETTGLADPAPVLHTLMADTSVTDQYRLDGVVTTVDAFNGVNVLALHPEAVRQVGAADVLVLTKLDLVDPTLESAVVARLTGINPCVPLHVAVDGRIDPGVIFGISSRAPLRHSVRKATSPAPGANPLASLNTIHRRQDVSSHVFVFDEPFPREGFLHWLDLMAAMRGDRLLRVKGLVRLEDDPDRPLVVHGVQHIFHPPTQLEAWPGKDRRTRLVFIVEGIDRSDIQRTFNKFVGIPETLES